VKETILFIDFSVKYTSLFRHVKKGPEGFNQILLIRRETVRSGTGSVELQPGNLIHLKPMKVD